MKINKNKVVPLIIIYFCCMFKCYANDSTKIFLAKNNYDPPFNLLYHIDISRLWKDPGEYNDKVPKLLFLKKIRDTASCDILSIINDSIMVLKGVDTLFHGYIQNSYENPLGYNIRFPTNQEEWSIIKVFKYSTRETIEFNINNRFDYVNLHITVHFVTSHRFKSRKPVAIY